MTLEAFIKPTSLPPAGSFRSIVAKTGSYALQLNGPTLELTILQLGRRPPSAGAGRARSSPVATYHVVGTYDGSTRARSTSTADRSPRRRCRAPPTRRSAACGSARGTARSSSSPARSTRSPLYNKALSAAQVAAHFAASQLPLGAPERSDGDVRLVLADRPRVGRQRRRRDGAGAAAQHRRRVQRADLDLARRERAVLLRRRPRRRRRPYWYRVRAVDASDELGVVAGRLRDDAGGAAAGLVRERRRRGQTGRLVAARRDVRHDARRTRRAAAPARTPAA